MNILFLFISVLILITAVSSKIYDLEQEALRLFGDDLSAVLHSFRKSMDYVHILSDRVSLIKNEIETMGNGIYYHELHSMNLELRYSCSGCEPNETHCDTKTRRSPRAVSSLTDLELEDKQESEPTPETTTDDTELKTELKDGSPEVTRYTTVTVTKRQSKALRGRKNTKKTKTDGVNKIQSINFVSPAMRKRALEKYRAVFNPLDDATGPYSISKTINEYGHMLREKSDSEPSTNSTKNGLKSLNDYPLRRYNKNKYVDIAFKHAKQLISDIISTFTEGVGKKGAARTYYVYEA